MNEEEKTVQSGRG